MTFFLLLPDISAPAFQASLLCGVVSRGDLWPFRLFSVRLLLFLIVSKFEGRADALRAVEALGTAQAHDSCLLI